MAQRLRARGEAKREGAAEGATTVLFKAPSGAKAKRVKLGFAWDLFLFAGFLGVPLFLRGLTNWGACVLALWLVDLALGPVAPAALKGPANVALFAGFLGLQLYLGFAGNALTARACRDRGWLPENPRDPATRRALEQWGIAP